MFFFTILFVLNIFVTTFASQFQAKSLSGGIGRRARLKLVFFGVWVRFPPQVHKTALNHLILSCFLVYKNFTRNQKKLHQFKVTILKCPIQNTLIVLINKHYRKHLNFQQVKLNIT